MLKILGALRRLPSMLAILLVLALPAGAQTKSQILVYGDSLSAAWGIPEMEGWVRLLQLRLVEAGYRHHVANASISGETTGGGLQRLALTLGVYTPDIVILELGGNDGLQGHPIPAMREDLTAMARLAADAGAAVVIVGVQLPPNYGPRYTADFEAAFAEVAAETGAALVPSLLAGLNVETMLQDDGIHPTSAAQPTLLDNVWEVLVPLLGPPRDEGVAAPTPAVAPAAAAAADAASGAEDAAGGR